MQLKFSFSGEGPPETYCGFEISPLFLRSQGWQVWRNVKRASVHLFGCHFVFNLSLLQLARFRCSKCGRSWPSNRVMVVFHMHLISGQGVVKVRRIRQNCKKCASAPMEKPEISPENISILMDNLVKKIRIKCYGENLDGVFRPPQNLEVNSPHEPAHCEACKLGICERNAAPHNPST